MIQGVKMIGEKKEYCKPEMDIVDMAYEPNVLQACSVGCSEDAEAIVDVEFKD